MNFSRVLVTGSSGFIGSHLVRELTSMGIRVKGFAPGHRLRGGDVTVYSEVEDALGDAEVVFHLAGISSAVASDVDTQLDFEVNVRGTYNVLNVALSKGVKRVVFASTSNVYGTSVYPTKETAPLLPTRYYGQSKLAAETYCRFYSRMGLDVVIARLFNAFGKGQRNRVIPDLIQRVRSTRRVFEIDGNAADSRDFLSIQQVVDALIILARAGKNGEAYNVGSGRETTVLELARLILKASRKKDKSFNKRIKYTYNKEFANRSVADVSKLAKLGFRPQPINVTQISELI